MRLVIPGLALVFAGATEAFAPVKSGVRFTTARSFGIDPSFFHDLPDHVHSLQDAFSSISLSDAVDIAPTDVVDALQDSAPAAMSAPVESVPSSSDVVDAAAAGSSNGWFGFLTGPTMGLLQLIHGLLVAVGVSQDAWGVTIIAITVLIKVVTFPLTKTQLESTNKMQALQPTIKELQAKYQSNPEVMNQKIAEVYQSNNVNPLAGCLPSLAQIPIFIGLYRAVLDLAKENKLDEPFLWLPNLEGPTYGADATSGSDWLFKGWVDGAPSLGWDDTAAFLILPVLLVVSQFVSMELMQPKNQESQSNFVLKLLPLMIGWFSLNVPAALCLYWITNNIITTATSLLIRNSMPDVAPVTTAEAPSRSSGTVFTPPPMREKPAGFGQQISDDEVKPITRVDEVKPISRVVEAEIVEDDDGDDADDEGPDTESSSSEPKPKKSRGKKRRKKKN